MIIFEKNVNFQLNTSKIREKFTDHEGVVRFLKSLKTKRLYIYSADIGKIQGGGG